MIKIPKLNQINETSRSITKFGGINRTCNVSEGKTTTTKEYAMEFRDTLNMCADDYPAIKTRDKRWNNGSITYNNIASADDIFNTDTVTYNYANSETAPSGATVECAICYAMASFKSGESSHEKGYDLADGLEIKKGKIYICQMYNKVINAYEYGQSEDLDKWYPTGDENYPMVHKVDFNGEESAEGSFTYFYNNYIKNKDGVQRCFLFKNIGTASRSYGVDIPANAYFLVTKKAEASGASYGRLFGADYDLGALNVKLYHANELLRLVPQYYGNDTSGEEAWDDDKLIYNDEEETDYYEKGYSCFGSLGANKTVDDVSITSIGAYVYIAPYNVWYNTEDGSLGHTGYEMAESGTYRNLRFAFDNTNEEFTYSSSVYINGAAASITTQNALYMPSASSVIYYNSGSGTSSLQTISKFYIGIFIPSAKVNSDAEEGDKVYVNDFKFLHSGATDKDVSGIFEDNTIYEIYKVDNSSDKSGTYFWFQFDSTYIADNSSLFRKMLITASKNESGYGSYHSATIYKEKPDIKYCCSLNNRIWGCSNDGHEIYASVQGSAKDWTPDSSVATSAYTATVGEGAEFTGCCSYGGYVYFFKKDRVFRVTGTRPATFSYTEIALTGCIANSSIRVINQTMYYLGKDGVYAYSGGVPTCISDDLDGGWIDGIAASNGSKYYLYRKKKGTRFADIKYLSSNDYSGTTEEKELIVYDSEKGMWHSEGEDCNWISGVESKDGMQYIDGLSWMVAKPTHYMVNAFLEDDFDWYCETGEWHSYDASMNYLKQLRIQAEFSGTFDLYVKYGDGDWELYNTWSDGDRRTLNTKFSPKRCEYFRLKFAGHGTCRIYNITEIYEIASEVK